MQLGMHPAQPLIVFPAALVAALLLLGFWPPDAAECIFRPAEQLGTRLARNKSLAIISTACAAIVLRLALLPFAPVPVPEYHDEFSYLLAADTFAHGRLANPPHPMWIFFDTVHVNQLPTYMSKYPPAQGFALAVGQVLGHPWIGTLLGIAAMTGAIVWALQGWVPAPWALLGGFFVLLRLGLFGYWVNGYWGGAVAATGGALAVGALPRIIHHQRARDSLVLGVGAAILANSRPFEGLIFLLPVLGALLVWLFRGRRLPGREAFPRVVIPILAVMLVCGMFMAYYNWRGTGNPLLLPYALNDKTYQTGTPSLLWRKATPMHYANAQFESFYNGWNHDTWQEGRADSIGKAMRLFGRNVGRFVRFFLWPELCVPFLAAFWIVRDRRMRLLILQTAICFGGFLLVAWFNPHYAAPVLPAVVILMIQGLRHLRKLRCQGRPAGIGLSRAVVISAIVLVPFHATEFPKPGVANRARIAALLEKTPGQHLVIVHYSPQHNSQAEWVYNRADIDAAKVVWAREIPGIDMAPLLAYFRDRRVWVVDADSRSPEPQPYQGRLSP
jgi:hypothetical protein